MLAAPYCWLAKCKHFRGVEQPDGTEASERVVCAAFPNGIPEEITSGQNDHTKPVEGDNGIQYERKEGE